MTYKRHLYLWRGCVGGLDGWGLLLKGLGEGIGSDRNTSRFEIQSFRMQLHRTSDAW
jgi:hypothetical protein